MELSETGLELTDQSMINLSDQSRMKFTTEESKEDLTDETEPVVKSSKVMYVLVYSADIQYSRTQRLKMDTFLRELKEKGFILETIPHTTNKELVFVTIAAPTTVYLNLAIKYNIELDFESTLYKPPYKEPLLKCMSNPLTVPDESSDIYKRAPEAVFGKEVQTVTDIERIMIIHKALSKTKFGIRWREVGVKRLKKSHILKDHFALHDGPWKWTETGPLGCRQLLKKYWGSINCCIQEHPIRQIRDYFGTELAFYSSWMGLYMQLLLPVSLLSIFCFMLGGLLNRNSILTKEVCNSQKIYCPMCDFRQCPFTFVNGSCSQQRIADWCENKPTIAFAIIMSMWSALVLELWNRKEAIRKLQWNVQSVEIDTTMRVEYEEQAFPQRINIVTDEMEPIVPKRVSCFRYTISVATLLLLALVILMVLIAVMTYRKAVGSHFMKQGTRSSRSLYVVASVSGSLMSGCVILIFERLYYRICIWLTTLENPRTKVQFDKSYIFKVYLLAFVNNYAVVFYISFLKYRFYTHPGNKKLDDLITITFVSDVCGPAGCITGLAMQLGIIMVVKKIPIFFSHLVWPHIKILFKKKIKKITVSEDMPQWEKDFVLVRTHKYYLIQDYIEMLIQYGFVTFFVSAFPLAPVLAFITNIFLIRIDAFRLLTAFRRPVPVRTAGLGVWESLLISVTYLGVVINACGIAFTSDFVERELYIHNHGNLTGFLDHKLSEFKVMDFFTILKIPYKSKYNRMNVTTCYYSAARYPPSHQRKYERTIYYWHQLAFKFLCVVVFEHVVIALRGFIAYWLPDIPESVQESIRCQKQKEMELRAAALNQSYLDTHKQKLNKFRIYSYLS